MVTIIFVKIELIVPAVEENARVPNLALPILAGLAPADVEISFTDDLLTPIDLGKGLKDVDLVGADAPVAAGVALGLCQRPESHCARL